MDWTLAVDGWAQAAWGTDSIHEFNGTLASKNFEEENKGDFLADWRSMFERMVAFGDAPLTAAALETINNPIEHQTSHSQCLSDYDPFTTRDSASTELAEHCARPSAFFHDQLQAIDPELYDSKGVRQPESQNFRMKKLGEYLDLYYGEVNNLPRDAHDQRLLALSRLAWNYAWLHPFCDGNGRTRTLILQRELCRLGYHPIINFDNNFELFYQVPSMLREQLKDAMFLWEDAYVFKCILWTPTRAATHRARFGAKSIGMPEDCSAEKAHRVTKGGA